MKKLFFITAVLLMSFLCPHFAEASGVYQSKAYHLDGDDWYNLYYGENLYVRVDDTDLDPITSAGKILRLTLDPATPFDVTIVYLSETLEYEITVGDLDTSASLEFTVEDNQTHAVEKTMALHSGSVIRIRAATMEAVFRDGGSDADYAWESMTLVQLDGSALRYDLEQSGDLLISVQKKPSFDTSKDPGPFAPAGEAPEATPPVDDTPIDVGGVDNPSTPQNPTPSPTEGNPSPSTSAEDGMMLGGGGSLFSCSLSTEGSSFNLDLVALGMMALLGAFQLLRKNKAR